MGTAVGSLATGVKAPFDAVERVGEGACGEWCRPIEPDVGRSFHAAKSIDLKLLEGILDGTALTKDGMAKFVFSRKTTMHGADAEAAMGVNT